MYFLRRSVVAAYEWKMLDICKLPWSILKGWFFWDERAALLENVVDGTVMELKIRLLCCAFSNGYSLISGNWIAQWCLSYLIKVGIETIARYFIEQNNGE